MSDQISQTAPLRYSGNGPDLFRLAFGTGLLTVVTLGIYRFWARTRIRKYIWSSTSADGDAFEYTGTGLEKLLGFLVAVVFLAVYLGIIQIVLFYFGLTVMVDPETATPREALQQMVAVYISFFAVVPFLFYAVYRARLYMLARTRWRGVRFGMEKGAWGYALRAIGHWLLTIVSLGILLPRQTFFLEKYMTDRSFFGTARFAQGGQWTELYRGMRHIFWGLFVWAVAALFGLVGNSPVLAGITFVVGYIWLLCGMVYFRAYSIGYLNDHKSLDGGAAISAKPGPGTVVGLTVKGFVIIAVLAGITLAAIGIIFTTTISLANGTSPGLVFVAVIVIAYLLALVLFQSLSTVLLTQPILAHHVNATAVENAPALEDIRQRAADTGLDAGGFADALDVGGAI